MCVCVCVHIEPIVCVMRLQLPVRFKFEFESRVSPEPHAEQVSDRSKFVCVSSNWRRKTCRIEHDAGCRCISQVDLHREYTKPSRILDAPVKCDSGKRMILDFRVYPEIKKESEAVVDKTK